MIENKETHAAKKQKTLGCRREIKSMKYLKRENTPGT